MPLSPFPNLYKKFSGNSWGGLLGDIAGSAQPGMFINGIRDSKHLQDLIEGKLIDEIGIDKALISNLEAIYNDGIRDIYCLIEEKGFRNTLLVKELWQRMYKDARYITEIDGESIATADLSSPTTEKLDFICDHLISSMNNGNNILVHCKAGMGRTGTILAAVYMRANKIYDAEVAIDYIREEYSDAAVETESQEKALQDYATHLQDRERSTYQYSNNANGFSYREKIRNERASGTSEKETHVVNLNSHFAAEAIISQGPNTGYKGKIVEEQKINASKEITPT